MTKQEFRTRAKELHAAASTGDRVSVQIFAAFMRAWRKLCRPVVRPCADCGVPTLGRRCRAHYIGHRYYARRVAAALLMCLSLQAAEVTLMWNASDPTEEIQRYFIYQATNVTGPFGVVTNVSTNTVRLTLPEPGRYFWFVTASNFWFESAPSNITNTPSVATKVQATKLQR